MVFTIPQSKIRDFCQLPLHKGAFGAKLETTLIPSPGECCRAQRIKISMLAGGKLSFSRVAAKLTGVERG